MKKTFKIILIVLVITGVASAILYGSITPKLDKTQITLFGNIDIRQVELSFHDAEHNISMNVKEGDRVKKGQLLATQDLDRYQYAIEYAEAKTDAQRQIVSRLETGSRPEDIRRSKADVKSAEAEVAFAQKELQRMQNLVKKKLTSIESVDRARKEYTTAQEKHHALQEQQEPAVIGPRKEDIEDTPMDIVINVCDNAAGETCPVYLIKVVRAHWGVSDPGHVEGSEEEKIAAFEQTFATLKRRVEKMLELPLETMPAKELIAELNVIGQLLA